jgi:hypothetical protein
VDLAYHCCGDFDRVWLNRSRIMRTAPLDAPLVDARSPIGRTSAPIMPQEAAYTRGGVGSSFSACSQSLPGFEHAVLCEGSLLKIFHGDPANHLKKAPRDMDSLEISLVPARLQEDAEEALIAVTRSVARGEPLVRCQLLASLFYEELLRQLRECPDNSDRVILGTAAAQCGRAATASTTPRDLLQELRSGIATLLSAPRSPLSSGRPVLRVIQGGLSKA